MILILQPPPSFSAIQSAHRLPSLLPMPLADGNSCSFQARKKMSFYMMTAYARLFGKSEDLAIRRLNDDKSIPFMPPSPKLFQKGVYFCSAMPRILCRPLVDRA